MNVGGNNASSTLHNICSGNLGESIKDTAKEALLCNSPGNICNAVQNGTSHKGARAPRTSTYRYVDIYIY